MTHTKRVTGFVASLFFSGLAMAWGATGHMAVGTIADRMIAGTNSAKQVGGQAAYKGLHYSGEDAQHHYVATVPPDYGSLKSDIQRRQVIRAGARLAQILTAIWP